jgi:hypothetical protein
VWRSISGCSTRRPWRSSGGKKHTISARLGHRPSRHSERRRSARAAAPAATYIPSQGDRISVESAGAREGMHGMSRMRTERDRERSDDDARFDADLARFLPSRSKRSQYKSLSGARTTQIPRVPVATRCRRVLGRAGTARATMPLSVRTAMV